MPPGEMHGHGKLERNGLVLLGCGKMGSAMLKGWLDDGLPASSVWVIDPNPSDWLRGRGAPERRIAGAACVALIAVKPQMMGDALPALAAMGGGGTVFLSVAAGIPIAGYERVLGADTPVIRAMPNTPGRRRARDHRHRRQPPRRRGADGHGRDAVARRGAGGAAGGRGTDGRGHRGVGVRARPTCST